MDIAIHYDYREDDVKALGIDIEKFAQFVLTEEGRDDNTEASISFVTDEEIAELNETYRGKVGPTDVLSFECDGIDDDEFDDDFFPEESFELGDIIIAVDVAENQCALYGTTFKDEMQLLLVHGLLHICGYDHIVEEEAVVMEAREQELLDAWKSKDCTVK